MNKAFYIETLKLHNFATFENTTISFESGFNAIVGETGSGKSLILEALQLVLGSRADKKLVRKSSDFATIEAFFEFRGDEIKHYFEEIGFPIDGKQICIKRIIYKDGQSKSFLNFQACNLQILSQISKRFIDLVGQFENQKLLSENYQLLLLDQFAQNQKLFSQYSSSYQEYLNLKNKLEQLLQLQKIRAQKIDYLQFQVEEIEKCSPSSEEEEKLLKQKFDFQNKEAKLNLASQLKSLTSESEDGRDVISIIKTIKSLLEKNSKLVNVGLIDLAQNIQNLTLELDSEIEKIVGDHEMELNIDEIIEKLDCYQKVKKKFGPSIDDVLQHHKNMKNELEELIKNEFEIEVVQKQIEINYLALKKLAIQLHSKRESACKKLSEELTQSVQELRMEGATMKIEVFDGQELGPYGLSTIQFMAETNKGEGFYKIKDIASGGELSRILLSLRKVLSSQDSISVFLFDEIDTGVGGETAIRIGKSLKDVSSKTQVIAITHLPQIANHASKLILVNKDLLKKDNDERTVSGVSELVGKELKDEIQAMLQLNQ